MKTINIFYEDFSKLSDFVEQHRSTFFSSAPRSILIQIFSGRCDGSFLRKVSAEIMELIPHAHVIGSTTSGEIMNGTVSSLTTVISFTVFFLSTVKSGCFLSTGQDDFELGRTIAAELDGNKAKACILFATSQTVNVEDVLNGILAVEPELPVFGGSAGNNSLSEQVYLISGHQVIDSGVVGVTFEGEQLNIYSHYHMGWQTLGKKMTVTKAERLRVYTIDHQPAYSIYRNYLGLDAKQDFGNVIEYPLILERHGIEIARTPEVYYDDDSIGFGGQLLVGEKVRLSFGHMEMILEAVDNMCRTISQQPVESIFVYSCECHRGFLQEHSKLETEPLQAIAPTAGFFTYGEFFHVGRANQLFNGTMTVLALSESAKKAHTVASSVPSTQTVPEEGSTPFKDNVARRNTGVLKALTHLVNTVTAELMESNEKLKYISLHDSLTGLYNRAYFEQEMKRLESLDIPVGIIVCDLDALKTINDLLGHSVGDDFLKSAAEIIATACSKNDIVARVGGDEFTILVPYADVSLLAGICQRLNCGTAAQRQLNPEKPLYLSVGYALKEQGHGMANAFKSADANMYKQKLAKKDPVNRQIISVLSYNDS